jgi:Uri superfamily endonuclease
VKNPVGQDSILLLGDAVPGGAYVLRLRVSSSIPVMFGRFKHGQPVMIAAGDWVYVGSAMGQRGAGTLARRLVRHATRTGDNPPHALRPALIAAFGDDRLMPRQKTLRWHIDYLLECLEVDLTHVIAVHSVTRLESTLAALAAERGQVVEPGLGASDAPGQTHLLSLPDGDSSWDALVANLRAQFG